MDLPSRYLKLYPGPNREERTNDFYPANTVEVNGESFHREALSEIFRLIQGKPNIFSSVDAFIAQEPENESDPHAIAVYIHEKKVGYIPKTQTHAFNELFAANNYGNRLWADAAIKYVVELDQFRVRLMAETPLRLDPIAMPFFFSQSLGLTEVNEDALSKCSGQLSWNQEQVGTDEVDVWTEKVPVLLSIAEDSNTNSFDLGNLNQSDCSVEVHLCGIKIANISGRHHQDLVKLIEQSQAPVLAAVVIYYNTFSPTYLYLQQIEGYDRNLSDAGYVFGPRK